MIDARKPKMGTITSANNGTGMHAVRIGEGLEPIPDIPSFYPAEQYFEGMDVVLGFINDFIDCPMIISHGFLPPIKASSAVVFPPVPTLPPFPLGLCNYRVSAYTHVELRKWFYPVKQGGGVLRSYTRFWWNVRIEAGEGGSYTWIGGFPNYGGSHSPYPPEWDYEGYLYGDTLIVLNQSYSYFQASCNWGEMENTEYSVYNEANGIQDYVQSTLESIDASSQTGEEVTTISTGALQENFVNLWNRAFPGTFT